MDIKKLLINSIIAAVLFFLLGWLIYGNLLDHYMRYHLGRAGHVTRPDPVMLYIALGNLLQGATLAYIFVRANVKSLADGLVTGGIVGFLVSASIDCIMYGTTFAFSKRAIVADVIAYTILCAVIGAVLGMVLSRNKKIA